MESMDTKKDTSKSCLCTSTHGLFIPLRHVSILVVTILCMLFFALIIGYFSGKKHILEHDVHIIEQTSFADRINTSLYELTEIQEHNNQELPHTIEAASTMSSPIIEKETEKDILVAQDGQVDGTHYYAQLAGFGTQRAARSYADTLCKKGFPVTVKKRRSRTAKGKSITWYQIVTQEYQSRQEVAVLVDRITKQEKLKDVRIVSIS